LTCSIVLPVIMNAIVTNPSGTMITTAASNVGAAAIASSPAPNAAPNPPSRRYVGRGALFAIVIAPANEPTPATADKSPNVPALPSKTRSASSGTSTMNWNDTVKMMASTISGRRRFGVDQA
jgi:hypothetical protein